MTLLTLRYDMRMPDIAVDSPSDRYAACLQQCSWADGLGFQTCAISEHHGVDDGFLPAPLVLAGAIASRTKSMMITVSALLVPFHEPLRLAEDLAVLSLLSRGRVGIVAGMGYRDEEFEIFGIDRKRRGRMLEEGIEVLRKAWTGEYFEYRGRTARVTPKPEVEPMILLGGSTEKAARRAARLRLPFMPAVGDDELERVYREACAEEGFDGGWVLLPKGPGFVHVSDDPERDWERIAPFALHEASTYHSWQQPGQRSQVHVDAQSIDDLKASGVYRVVTPDECVTLAQEIGPMGSIVFHPLMGGMDIDLGWESLQLFADKVLPRLS